MITTREMVLLAVGISIAAVVMVAFYIPPMQFPNSTSSQTVQYACTADKRIVATYHEGETTPPAGPDLPPTPGGSVDLALSDGRHLSLAQTISADGARYATTDEAFVFWSKGAGALVLENNVEKSYIGCIMVASDPGGLSQVYRSDKGFTLRLPSGYKVRWEPLGEETQFTIDPTPWKDTNLSSDTYLSVGESPIAECHNASSTDAAAGNRYENSRYVLLERNPCIAVNYFIHYGVIENYPAGTVREFDKEALIREFDAIRKTLVVVR